MDQFDYFPGTVPVIISVPHAGTHIPPAILERFCQPAKQLPDTDWHVGRLYAFARELGAHMLCATHSRYVIDLNRAPDGQSLYPGRFTTGLCPLTLFDGTPLYQPGQEPDAREIGQRTMQYWQPYHRKLQDVMGSLRQLHKKLVVFDAHSIRSRVPALFEGTLPALNLGTADGTADAGLTAQLAELCRASPYSAVHNGRFRGGYITRHYANPGNGVHSVQLELAQEHYMQEEAPYAYDAAKAEKLQPTLRALMSHIVEWVGR